MVLQRILSPDMRFLLSGQHLRLMFGSGVLWGLGDVGAQAITHYSISDRRAKKSQDKDEEFISFRKNEAGFKIDWSRVYSASCFGIGSCIGPAAYYRFTKSLRSSAHPAEVVGSAIADGLFGTLSLAAFFPFTGFAQRSATTSVEQAKEEVKRGFTPALVLGGAVLPAALFANWRFVPSPYQFHCANLFTLVASCSLSWIELQKHNAVTQEERRVRIPEHGRRSKV